MTFLLAILPILLVLLLMLILKRGSHEAGFAGWVSGLIIAVLAFGLNWQVFWVSQVKALLLVVNVVTVLWSALILYHLVDQAGGVAAISNALQEMIPDPGWLAMILAWMLSALVENLAGFGLPIAIVAPMLIMLGVSPVRAVAAAAIGHCWAVSLGDMALAFRTLADVVNVEPAQIFTTAALLVGVSVLTTGIGVAVILGQTRYWKRIIGLGIAVALLQYGVGAIGMIPLSSFTASVAGIVGGFIISRRSGDNGRKAILTRELKAGLVSYGFLFVIVMVVSLVAPLGEWLSSVRLTSMFPEVATATGKVTPAGYGFIYKPLIHPGTLILLTAIFTAIILPRITGERSAGVRQALKSTFHSALPASLGAIFMIGLSALMEHTGMTGVIAGGMSSTLGSVYPLLAPLVGALGAFATGSNTNSNILFGPMQKGVAELLKVSPLNLLASQSTGGALGSMIAPAKLAVGGSTNAMKGKEGEVMVYTLPVALASTLLVGLLAWILTL